MVGKDASYDFSFHKFTQVCIVVKHVTNPGEFFMSTWEKCLFCCFGMEFNFLLMGGAVFPPCSLAWIPRTIVVSPPEPAAGHCWPTPPPETPRHSQVSLAQSLAESLLLPPGSWCPQGFVVASKSLFPWWCSILLPDPQVGKSVVGLELFQQCENFFGIIVLQFMDHLLGGSIVGLMVTSSKRTDATCQASQVCCSQSPCPHSRSLLTRASTRDTQTLKCVSSSVSCGGHCSFPLVLVHTRFCLHPLSVPGGSEIWFLNMPFLASATVLLGLLLFPWIQGILFTVGSNILMSMVVQQLVVILVFT